jgi:RHH-type proline utilization regulon transcriptional repressor/proline dehydrogenase/delta 1-pyrroline-5-carboxylate dehydrogenase
VVRAAVRQAMRILAEQFVLAETIEEAVQRGAKAAPYVHSYDMLGEAARTAADAAHYLELYARAIRAVKAPDGISIKLSALHPRFEEAKRSRVFSELLPRLRALADLATRQGIGFTIDAEESERLELTLELHAALAKDTTPGLAVQAYQKRALPVCDWLVALGRRETAPADPPREGRVLGQRESSAPSSSACPTTGVHPQGATDLSYVACASDASRAPERSIRPLPRTTAAPSRPSSTCPRREFEFQKLVGMGDALYDALSRATASRCACTRRSAASPISCPTLVRRMLENGANTSFVHQIADPDVPLAALVADPLAQLPEPYTPDERIPLPRNLYPDRLNSLGLDLSRRECSTALQQQIASDRACRSEPPRRLDATSPARRERFERWSTRSRQAARRAPGAAADLLEARMGELVSLIVREGGRTYADAVAEVREAADFCRYYALQAKRLSRPEVLPGPPASATSCTCTARRVRLHQPVEFPARHLHRPGRGGACRRQHRDRQAGRADAAHRPACGRALARSRHPRRRGVLRVGDGSAVGARLVADPRIAGVAFTGSVETAKLINQALAKRDGPIVPLIAETGGVNAMLVDSSALPEQVVDDTLISAFQSAGQRCSAQRILFLDEGAAPRILQILSGALAELKVGDPAEPDTDIGPVIDAGAAPRSRGTSRSCAARQADRRSARARRRALHRADRVPALARGAAAHRGLRPVLHVCTYHGSNSPKSSTGCAPPASASRSASTAASRASSTR